MTFLRSFSVTFVLILSAGVGFAQINRDAGKIYADYCAGCHGESMRGGKAGSLLDAVWRNGSDDAGLEKSIRFGFPNSGMPAFDQTFSSGEIRALVVLIKEASGRAMSPELKGAYPLPEGIQENGGQKFRVEKFVDGLDVPWSIAFISEREALVTERIGRIRRIRDGVLLPEPIKNVPQVWAHDEGGLLSLVLDPKFSENHWLYFSFADPGEGNRAMTKVVRARLEGDALVDVQTILGLPKEQYQESGMHFGSRLVFHDGYLFVSVGERGAVGEAQDLSKPNGKVHRLLPDGSIPADNPFVNTPGAVPSIWSYGHRNPQGLAFDPRNGDLWETEHGPRGGDELNHILPGRNYGWPVVTFGMNYDGTPISPLTAKPGMEPPVVHWTPSIATSPIMFYPGDRFPKWKNQLFLGSLAQQELIRFNLRDGKVVEEERVFKNLGRIRDIQTGPDGLIYIALEIPGGSGRIVRLVPE